MEGPRAACLPSEFQEVEIAMLVSAVQISNCEISLGIATFGFSVWLIRIRCLC